VHLLLSLNSSPAAIFVPTRTSLFDYYNANKNIQYHKTKTGFLIGKSSPLPITCPLFKDENIDEKQKSHYDFCDERKKNKDCFYNNNTVVDTQTNQFKLKSEVRSSIKKDFELINSINPKNLTDLCSEISQKGWCPYYYLKGMVKEAETKILDFQYFISNDLAKHVGIGSPKHIAIIDEFDILESRLKDRFETNISYKKIEKYIKKKRIQINKSKNEEPKLAILDATIFQIVSEFGAGLRKIGRDGSRLIDFEIEFEKNKHLKECLLTFNDLRENNNFREDVRHIINEKKDIVHKIFSFLNSMNEINKFDEGIQTFIEYVEKTDDIYIKRLLISLKGFFKRKNNLYDKIVVASATLPHDDFLRKDFGDEIETIHSSFKIGKKRGIIYQSESFNLESNSLNNNFDEKINTLVDLIKKIPEKRIVIFYKSSSIFNSQERMGTLNKIFSNEKIKKWIIEKYPLNEHKMKWNEFIKTTEKERGVMFCSSFGRYARGSNQLKDDNCRVVIIWGKPVEPEPTYEKPLQYQIHEHFNDYFLKKEINLNFQQFWYGLKPRKSIHQIVGRLTRSTNDFGFFIICSKENLENVIDKQTRSDLDIISVTRDEEDVLDAMEDFFQGVNSINGRY
jgi:Rad3-related DNA helicase